MRHCSVNKLYNERCNGYLQTLVTTLNGAQVAAVDGALVTDTNNVSVPIAIEGKVNVTGISCELVEQC